MTRNASLLLAALATGACASGPAGQSPATPEPAPSQGTAVTTTTSANVPATADQPSAAMLEAAARADSLRASWTDADVMFITHMIPHHAQALVMARMAETNDAGAEIRVLAGRIINAQNDEIALMQRWLRDRGLPVSDPEHELHSGRHDGMAGMLSHEQLERLRQARGHEFDRLFLQYMIQHHEGALVMVRELFDTYGAAQGDAIFKIASDIGADQETEIARMRLMLRERVFETGNP